MNPAIGCSLNTSSSETIICIDNQSIANLPQFSLCNKPTSALLGDSHTLRGLRIGRAMEGGGFQLAAAEDDRKDFIDRLR